MKVLNLYYSLTGNTEKIARSIEQALIAEGHHVDMVKIGTDTDIEILPYDLVFAGSGVYEWLPGQAMVDLFTKLRRDYAKKGDIVPASPKRPGKNAVIYCSYGGTHTGVNEAIPAIKYMAQLFDHLGYTILDEWYVVGAYPEKMEAASTEGRLGDIRGRPNELDLHEVKEKVKGILRV